MILLGGLVAGLKAGLVWNTFPLMGKKFIPMGLYDFSPWYLSPFEDRTTAQFNHRIVAYCIGVLAIWLLMIVICADVTRPYKIIVVSCCMLIADSLPGGIGGGVILLRITGEIDEIKEKPRKLTQLEIVSVIPHK